VLFGAVANDVNPNQAILHGSPEAKKEGELESQQHSQLVGRGKYIHAFESV